MCWLTEESSLVESLVEVEALSKEDALSQGVILVKGDAPLVEDAPSQYGFIVKNPRDFDVVLNPRISPNMEKTGLTKDTISILVDMNDHREVLKIGSQLIHELRVKLTKFLLENLDVFAWSHANMVGIDPEVMCYHLNIYHNRREIRQKRRPVSEERVVALNNEVDRLLDVGLIRESHYP